MNWQRKTTMMQKPKPPRPPNFYPGLLDEFVLGRAAYQVSAFVCVSKWLEQSVLERAAACALTSEDNLSSSPPLRVMGWKLILWQNPLCTKHQPPG
jgi:hypothetical protein